MRIEINAERRGEIPVNAGKGGRNPAKNFKADKAERGTMIKIENVDVVGWEHAIRGMRNPMNSWDKSDTAGEMCCIGKNDLDLINTYFTVYKTANQF